MARTTMRATLGPGFVEPGVAAPFDIGNLPGSEFGREDPARVRASGHGVARLVERKRKKPLATSDNAPCRGWVEAC
jgi:hypothetical protein